MRCYLGYSHPLQSDGSYQGEQDNKVGHAVGHLLSLLVDKVVYVSHKFKIPPFSHKVIHGRTSLMLHGCKMNVKTLGLKKRSTQLPLGIDVLSSYVTITTRSNTVAVVLRNNTRDWVEIGKGIPVVRMVVAKQKSLWSQLMLLQQVSLRRRK